jgi:hypothetical protein
VCVIIYIFIYTYIHTYIHTYIYRERERERDVCVHTHIHTYSHTHTHTYSLHTHTHPHLANTQAVDNVGRGANGQLDRGRLNEGDKAVLGPFSILHVALGKVDVSD